MAEKWARIWIIPEGRSQGTIVSADSPGSLHGQKTRGYEVTYEVKKVELLSVRSGRGD